MTVYAHYWRRHSEEISEFDTNAEALDFLASGEEHEELSAERVDSGPGTVSLEGDDLAFALDVRHRDTERRRATAST